MGIFTTPSNYMSNATCVISQLTNFTVNCWMYLTYRQAREGDRQSIFSATSADGQEEMWMGTYGQSGTRAFFSIATNGVGTVHYTGQQVPSNVWSMLTFVLSSTNMYTYINAVNSSNVTQGLLSYPRFNTATNPMIINTIGSQMIGSAPIAHWYGLNSPIDNLAIWTNALSYSEVTNLYNGGLPLSDNRLTTAPYNNGSLVALWRFESNVVNIVNSSTGRLIGVTNWVTGVVPIP